MNYHISFDLDFKRNPYPGKFIVIEGIDGSGKTTQAKLMVGKIANAVVTKEPTTGPIGKFIREVLSGGVGLPASALQHLLSADRATHEEEIKNLLKKGRTVVSDRYLWSSVAYGMADKKDFRYKTGEILLIAQSILSMYHQFILPDLTIYLRISVDTALKRLASMEKTPELYENSEKLEKIYMGYEWLAKQFPKEITVIDGERTVEEVTEEILDKIKLSS